MKSREYLFSAILITIIIILSMCAHIIARGISVSPVQVEKAFEKCHKHGGLREIRMSIPLSYSRQLVYFDVECQDDAKFIKLK